MPATTNWASQVVTRHHTPQHHTFLWTSSRHASIRIRALLQGLGFQDLPHLFEECCILFEEYGKPMGINYLDNATRCIPLMPNISPHVCSYCLADHKSKESLLPEYATVDFIFCSLLASQARLKEAGCPTCADALVITTPPPVVPTCGSFTGGAQVYNLTLPFSLGAVLPAITHWQILAHEP